jgi:tRNA pseudouridine synthase 9
MAIESGQVTVNKEPTSATYLLCNSDLIEHTLIRYEPPIIDSPLVIVFQSPSLLVVSKPGSIPVHPTGRYNFNSVTQLLIHNHGFDNLFPVNRIDRLTSGLVLIARTKTRANHMMRLMQTRTIQKKYLARVKGNFTEGTTQCRQKIDAASKKTAINRTTSRGKQCLSLFRKLH